MRLVNGHTRTRMNHHWAKHLEPCKCGSKQMVLYREEHNDTMFIRCGKCHLTGTPATTYEDAIRQFKVVQLIN